MKETKFLRLNLCLLISVIFFFTNSSCEEKVSKCQFILTDFKNGKFEEIHLTSQNEKLIDEIEVLTKNYESFLYREGNRLFFKELPFSNCSDPSTFYHLTRKARLRVALKNEGSGDLLNQKFTPVFHKRHMGLLRVDEMLEKDVISRYNKVFLYNLEQVLIRRKISYLKKDDSIYVSEIVYLDIDLLWNISEEALERAGNGNLPTDLQRVPS